MGMLNPVHSLMSQSSAYLPALKLAESLMMFAICCFSSLSCIEVRGGMVDPPSGLYWMVLMLSKSDAETGEREEEVKC